MIRKIALGLILVAVAGHAAYQWKSVQIRGGGYVPGIIFHPAETGLAYIRTDIGGSYRLNADDSSWTPLNDMFTDGGDMGSIALGIDASDANYLYLTGGLYTDLSWCNGASFLRSADKGVSWTKISLNASTVSGISYTVANKDSALCLAGNGEGRGMGNRVAAKGTTIYLATNQNGLLKSTDRGNTWTTVSHFGNTVGIGAVAFDAAGNIYAAPSAGGLYKSANGSSWTQVSGFTGIIYQMVYSSGDNTIWMTVNTGKPLDQNEISGGSVYKYNVTAGSIVQVTMPAKGGKDYGYLGISVNPTNSNQVLVSTGGWWKGSGGPASGTSFVSHEGIFMTLDGGSSWTDIIGSGSFDAGSAGSSATSNPHWISALAVDPFDKDHVVFGTGYGVWSTYNATATAPTWYFTDTGIEETAPLGLVSTTYGAPLVSALGDIDGFYHASLDVAQSSRHQVEAGTNYAIDYAGLYPHVMIRIFKEATKGLGAYSTNGGKTWTSFAAYPPFVNSGYSNTYTNETNFAAISADASAIVWNMEKYGVYYSTDFGSTWKASATKASLLAGYRVIADKVTPGTFYLYANLTTADSSGYLYKSVDNGANWTVVRSDLEYDDSWASNNFRLFVSPDAAGDLWITQGANIYKCDDPNGNWCAWYQYTGEIPWTGKANDDNVVYHSTDGGKTVVAVDSLLYATYIGFGKGKTAGVSAVYAAGMVKPGIAGVFRSDDQGKTWTKIDDDAHQYGGISMIVGDPCVDSRIYVTGAGRGIIYGQEPGSTVDASCANREENGTPGELSIRVTPEPQINESFFYREGLNLISVASVQLYDLSGRWIRSAKPSGGIANMSLMGLNKGVYLAKSGSKTMKVNLQ